MMTEIVEPKSSILMPEGYDSWRKAIEDKIETAKLKAAMHVNSELLSLYWSIGRDVLLKQEELGWGKQVIAQLSHDLSSRFPDDRGYSERNLGYMKQFAKEYPDFPFLQVPLAVIQKNPILQVALAKLPKDDESVHVPLTQISWYHHISMIPKVKNIENRAFYIMATAHEGWSRDTMLTQIANGYIEAKGSSVNNFDLTLPSPQSDLAKYTFKDPYNFSFLGTVALQNELDIEKGLASRVVEFLLEMGKGFAFIGRQYHLSVDESDYYIDILMYHLQLHCYVVVELKAVEFKPEFVSKLNFYISAVDEQVKSPEDKPTIGLLLCRSKSDTKARFALRGFTQPLGIAEYETQKLFAEVASSLPQIEDLDEELDLLTKRHNDEVNEQ